MRSRDAVLCLILASLLLLGAGGSIWLLHRNASEKKAVAWVPGIPDLRLWPEEMARQVREASAAAHQQVSVATLSRLAGLYQANGLLEPARIALTGLRALEPGNARWAYRLADVEMRSGHAAAAEAALVAATGLAPDYPQAWLRLGYLLTERRAIPQAQACYARALQAAPEDFRVAYLQAAFLAHYGDRRLALSRIEGLTRSRPEISEGQKLLAEVRAALGDAAGAVEARRQAEAAKFNLSSEDPWIDELAGLCFDPYRLSLLATEAAGEQRYAASVGLLHRAIDLAPADAQLRITLASVLGQMGQPGTELETLAKGIAEVPGSVDLRVQFARALCASHRGDEALVVLREALARQPENATLLAAQGFVLRSAGRNEAALPVLQASLRSDPNQVETQYDLGACLLALERRGEARAAAELALAMRPDYREPLILLASMALEAEDTAAAAGPVERLRASYPEDPATRMMFGTWLLLKGAEAEQVGEIDEALAFNRRGCDAAPNYAPLLRQAGSFFMRHGKTTDAAAAYERLVRLTPDDPAAYRLLADAWQGGERNGDSRAILERGLAAAEKTGNEMLAAEFKRRLGR